VDRPETLRCCLNALVPQLDGSSHEVIVVDQGGFPVVVPKDTRVRYIRSEIRGLSSARNLATSIAQGEVLAFIDDDAVPADDYLAVIERLFIDTETDAVAGRVLISGTTVPYAHTQRTGSRVLGRAQWQWVLGANIVVRKNVLTALRGFDERFGAGRDWSCGEESDLFFRMCDQGLKVLYAPELIVYHPAEQRGRTLLAMVPKYYAYGRGQGALMAKHREGGHSAFFITQYYWMLLKPVLRMLQFKVLGRADAFAAYQAIFNGRRFGVREFVRKRALSRRNTLKICVDLRSIQAARCGVSRVAEMTLRHLIQQDATNTYYYLIDSKMAPVLADSLRGARPIIIASGRFNPIGDLFVARALRRHGVHIYHSIHSFLPIGLPRSLTLVLTVHDLFAMKDGRFFAKYGLLQRVVRHWFNMQLTRSIRIADVLIAPSQYAARDIISTFPEASGKVHVVYNASGIDPALINGEPPVERVARRDYYLFVGNSRSYKNIGVLLCAFDELVGRRYGKRLIMAGNDLKEARAALVNHKSARSIELLERVDDRRLVELYRYAIAVVLPSKAEGFGIPIIEAMQCGTPTIVSDADALLEIAADASIRFPKDDPHALAEAMERVANDDVLWHELQARGFRRAGMFSWEKSARALYAVYNAANASLRNGPYDQTPPA